jgi:hypothetical protein
MAMTTSELMQAMSDAGAPLEAIIIAVRALDERDAEIRARDAEVSNRRHRDAARKREERAAAALSTDSPRTVHGCGEDNPSLDKESFPQTPFKEIKPIPDVCTAPARKGNPFPKPDFADAQVWLDFLANRKSKHLSNTPTAYTKFLRDIEKFTDEDWPPGRILEHAVAAGWGGIYDPKPQEHRNGHQHHHNGNRPSTADAVLAARTRLGID